LTISYRLPERGNFSVYLKGAYGEARLCVRGKTFEEAEKRAVLCASRQPVAWLDSEGNERREHLTHPRMSHG
jgi:hypothetical protein